MDNTASPWCNAREESLSLPPSTKHLYSSCIPLPFYSSEFVFFPSFLLFFFPLPLFFHLHLHLHTFCRECLRSIIFYPAPPRTATLSSVSLTNPHHHHLSSDTRTSVILPQCRIASASASACAIIIVSISSAEYLH